MRGKEGRQGDNRGPDFRVSVWAARLREEGRYCLSCMLRELLIAIQR